MTARNMSKILVKPGDSVSAGDTLFIMEVMKTESRTSPLRAAPSARCR